MERNNDQRRNPAGANRGGNNPNRGRGFGRGNGFANNNNHNNTNNRPLNNNNTRGPNPQHGGQKNNSNPKNKEKEYEERPWTFGQLRAWLKKTIATDPDQILSNLTGRDEKKFKNALNEIIVVQEPEIVELMIELLAFPDLMDHIRSTTSGAFYSMVMASKFLSNLATFMVLDGARLSKRCISLQVKLLGHLLDLSPDSIYAVLPLIQHLATLAAMTEDENLALEITKLVAKKDHMIEHRKKKTAQAKDEGGPKGSYDGFDFLVPRV